MTKLEEAKLRDQNKIEKIKSKWDIHNLKDIEEIMGLMQSGSIQFETSVGREFDDMLYEERENLLKAPLKKEHTNKTSRGASQKTEKRKLAEKTVTSTYERNRKIIMGLSLIVAVGCLAYFTFYCLDAYHTKKNYEALSQLKKTDFSLLKNQNEKYQSTVTVDEKPDTPDILEDYKTLYNNNKSLIGWLKIDDTKIDYPVMQSKNEEYYLNHNFNQEEDRNGSLFIDKDCSIWPRSQNIIIYGHNMKSGKMFGGLREYKSESYYKKHKTISFDTLYEKGEYEIMYVFSEIVHDEAEVTFKYYQFINANSEEEYDSNMNTMKEMSLYDTGVESHYGDQLITLSTCDYTKDAERFAIVARKVD